MDWLPSSVTIGKTYSHPEDLKAFRTYWVRIFPMAKGQCYLSSSHVSTFLSHGSLACLDAQMGTRRSSSRLLEKSGVGS